MKFWKEPKVWVDRERGETRGHVDLLLEDGETLIISIVDHAKGREIVELFKIPGLVKVHLSLSWEGKE